MLGSAAGLPAVGHFRRRLFFNSQRLLHLGCLLITDVLVGASPYMAAAGGCAGADFTFFYVASTTSDEAVAPLLVHKFTDMGWLLPAVRNSSQTV